MNVIAYPTVRRGSRRSVRLLSVCSRTVLCSGGLDLARQCFHVLEVRGAILDRITKRYSPHPSTAQATAWPMSPISFHAPWIYVRPSPAPPLDRPQGETPYRGLRLWLAWQCRSRSNRPLRRTSRIPVSSGSCCGVSGLGHGSAVHKRSNLCICIARRIPRFPLIPSAGHLKTSA